MSKKQSIPKGITPVEEKKFVMPYILLSDEEKIKRLHDTKNEYPEGHLEYEKITIQINKLSVKGFPK